MGVVAVVVLANESVMEEGLTNENLAKESLAKERLVERKEGVDGGGRRGG